MFLAWREIRRAKVRFALLSGAVAMLVFLILFQYGIQSSLVRQFVGGVRRQSAPVLVFNVDGRRTPQASTVDGDLEAKVRATAGVGAVAPIWASTFPMTTSSTTTATSVVGYADPGLGGPERLREGRWPERTGEVIANSADASSGYGLGATLTVAPAGPRLTVVGVADDIGINVVPTVFVAQDTYLEVLRTRNPEAVLPPPNVLGVAPAEGVAPDELAARISASDPDLDALTRSAAADGNPGVASIRQSFNVIFLLFALVVPLVTGLFFLIVTFQKASSLTLLRAIGAPARRLVAALLVQVGLVLGAGCLVGVAAYYLLSQRRVSSLTLRFEMTAALGWTTLLVTLGVLSALAAVRRVLAIDPIDATTGAGVRL